MPATNDVPTWEDTEEAPAPTWEDTEPYVKPSPYEQLTGRTAGLGATTGPASPEEVIPSYLALAEPALRLPRLHPSSALGKIAAAPVNVAEGIVEGVTSPVGAATLPAFSTRLGRMLMGGAAVGQGGYDMLEALRQRDLQRGAEGALEAGIGGLLLRPETVPPLQGPVAEGALLRTPRGAPVPRGEPVPGLETVSPEVAALQAKRMQREATAAVEPRRLPKPTVPEGPAEATPSAQAVPPAPKEIATWDDAVAELSARGTGKETRAQIQKLFPQLSLSKQVARGLAKAAFGDEWAPGGVSAAPKKETAPVVTPERPLPVGPSPEQETQPAPFVISETTPKPNETPPVTPVGIEETLVAGKPFGQWEGVTEASGLPKGDARAELAKWLAVPNKPADILRALKNKKRTREIHAPPVVPEAVAPLAEAPAPETPSPTPAAESPETLQAQLAAEIGEEPALETKTGPAETKPPVPATPAPVPETIPAKVETPPKAAAKAQAQAVQEEAEQPPPPEPGPGGVVGMGGAALGEIEATGPRGEPTHGIAARVLEQRRQQGTIAPVEPGEGISPEESVERGRALLAQGADPQKVLDDFNRTKAVSAEGIAIARAHGERLERTAYAMADAHGIHSPEYEAAWEADSAWAQAVKPMQTEWHKIGQAQQGETEIDTGTFHGLRKAFFDATGQDFTPDQAQEAKRIAKGVQEAAQEADKAKADVFAQVEKQADQAGTKPTETQPGDLSAPTPATLWKRAKAIIDAGDTDFDSVRHKLAAEFGIPVENVTRQLAKPKGVKPITDEMYRKMSDQRNVVQQAKNWLRSQAIPPWLGVLRSVPRVFFTDKILGHGTVGMITHAGLNMFDPRAWNTYWPNFFRQYKLVLSKPYHERMMQDLLRDPLFTKGRRAGLANDPFRYPDDYQTPTLVKWLDKIGLTGNRGFDALKLFRQAQFNQAWNKLPDTLQTPEYAKLLADSVNHATGVVRRPFREWTNWTFFAPKLEASRWAWMIKGPWEAAKTFVDWDKASPEARAFAMSQLKEKAIIAGTYYALLAANEGLLEAADSKDHINFTNPRRGDFMAFKALGHNIGIVGPMLGIVRLFANLYHAAAGKRGKVESLESRASEFGSTGFDYARGKLSPFAGFGMDVISQADFQGRPLPFSSDRVPKNLRRQGLQRYTYGEYAAQEFTPIPVSEAVREVWRDQGMKESTINAYLNALAVGVAAGSTGARVSTVNPK